MTTTPRDLDKECIYELTLYESAYGLLQTEAVVPDPMREAMRCIVDQFEKRYLAFSYTGALTFDKASENPYFNPVYGHHLDNPFQYHDTSGRILSWDGVSPLNLSDFALGREMARERGNMPCFHRLDPRIGVLRTLLRGRRVLIHSTHRTPVTLDPHSLLYLKDQILFSTQVVLENTRLSDAGIIVSELWVDGISMADDLVAGGCACEKSYT